MVNGQKQEIKNVVFCSFLHILVSHKMKYGLKNIFSRF